MFRFCLNNLQEASGTSKTPIPLVFLKYRVLPEDDLSTNRNVLDFKNYLYHFLAF